MAGWGAERRSAAAAAGRLRSQLYQSNINIFGKSCFLSVPTVLQCDDSDSDWDSTWTDCSEPEEGPEPRCSAYSHQPLPPFTAVELSAAAALSAWVAEISDPDSAVLTRLQVIPITNQRKSIILMPRRRSTGVSWESRGRSGSSRWRGG